MVEAAEQVSDSLEDLPTRTLSHSERGLVSGGGCIVSKMVGKYGPYRYHVKKVNGKQTWTYLGKGGKGGTKHSGLVSGELEKEAEA